MRIHIASLGRLAHLLTGLWWLDGADPKPDLNQPKHSTIVLLLLLLLLF